MLSAHKRYTAGARNYEVTLIVIDFVPFRPKRPKFFILVCKLVLEYPCSTSDKISGSFGPFRSFQTISANFPRCKFRSVQDLAYY